MLSLEWIDTLLILDEGRMHFRQLLRFDDSGCQLLIIVEDATPEMIRAAWETATKGSQDDDDVVRHDRYGSAIHWNKFGDCTNRFGWLVAQNETGQLEAVHNSIRLPEQTRKMIDGLRRAFP